MLFTGTELPKKLTLVQKNNSAALHRDSSVIHKFPVFGSSNMFCYYPLGKVEMGGGI